MPLLFVTLLFLTIKSNRNKNSANVLLVMISYDFVLDFVFNSNHHGDPKMEFASTSE